ncbi:Ribosomal protein S18 acetylase RimI [Agromyces sp. CF514]|uniref:GNAT family N-acetyltransferase n=1 Tax=Agromyces sp. CF514 TaxID=1881031 RepID=UPI0008E747ED|nr:GNAT family N-acetyltransferase [Agromyces sp. CF514]SFR84648.1 Ribosomal protein S18 acetylase RimI [Agromyces sp. CF514]
MASVQIELLSELSDPDATELEKLLGQLSTAAFDRSRIVAMLDRDCIELFVARDGRRIVGMATLVTVPLPTGWRGHVEDVVVDATIRGRGVARLLLERLTSLASERELRTLDLTSRPSRESALRLYEAVGFVRRDTNVLRFTPQPIDETASR